MERVLVFDLAGVICDYLPKRRLDAISEATGLSHDRIVGSVWESGLDARAERGEFDAAGYTDAINDALGVSVPQEVYRKAWAASLPINYDVLSFARATARRTAVFSNNGPLLSDVMDNELAEVADAVDNVVVSWQTGASKPLRAAYDGLGEILGAAPSEMIMVDDKIDNVNGARAAGIDAIHFCGVEQLRQQLRLRHIVVNEIVSHA